MIKQNESAVEYWFNGIRWKDNNDKNENPKEKYLGDPFNDLEEGFEEVEYDSKLIVGSEYEETITNESAIKDINVDKFKQKELEEEKEKLTIYISKDMANILRTLKKQRRISSFSDCISKSLIEYLELKSK